MGDPRPSRHSYAKRLLGLPAWPTAAKTPPKAIPPIASAAKRAPGGSQRRTIRSSARLLASGKFLPARSKVGRNDKHLYMAVGALRDFHG
jgi:hypothetical protein